MTPNLAVNLLGVVLIKEKVEDEEDFYNEKYLEEYVENDEINGLEDGFMMGYLID